MTRFLLIGLDGAEPSLMTEWMNEGRLPHLAALRDRGCFGPLRSTCPPVTFPAWTTCVTGVNPGKHGIIDFTEMLPGQYALRFVNASHRRAPALWNILSEAGRRVGVLGVPGTYPPEPVNGFMVSGFDSPVATTVGPSMVYPASLFPEVKQWRFADFQESRIGPGWHDRAAPALLRAIADKEAIACRMLAREPWDFFMVVFGESDTAGHHFWLFHDPRSPRHRPGHAHVLRNVYERLDTAVGALTAAAGDETRVAVVSDHGFGGAGDGVIHLNNWLAENGYLQFTDSPTPWMKRLALAALPAQWQGALFRRFPHLAGRAESQSRFGGIDWVNTSAWSEELNYFPSIRINLQGREPQGRVRPQDYTELVRTLCVQLETWHPIAHAWPRDTVYHGACVDKAPDIILEAALENGYAHACLRSRGGPSFRRLRPDEHLGGKERGMNGVHRPMGVIFLSQPANINGSGLEDIAPTVLAALGVSAPPMDGRALWDTEKPSAGSSWNGGTTNPYTAEEEALLERRLRGLGYFE